MSPLPLGEGEGEWRRRDWKHQTRNAKSQTNHKLQIGTHVTLAGRGGLADADS
jgi:hypothetical protein